MTSLMNEPFTRQTYKTTDFSQLFQKHTEKQTSVLPIPGNGIHKWKTKIVEPFCEQKAIRIDTAIKAYYTLPVFVHK